MIDYKKWKYPHSFYFYVDICDGPDEISSPSFITSPEYPENNYPDDKDCERVIRFEEEKSAVIEFVGEFEIEDDPQCLYDYLEIRNGTNSNSQLITEVCGNDRPETITIYGNVVWIKFKSDSSVNKKGFRIKVWQFDKAPGNTYYIN